MGNHLTQSDSEKPLLWAGKQCQQMRVWTAWWNHAEAGWNHCLIPREIQSVASANEQPGQWFTHWRRDVGLCQSQSLGDAGTQQPQAGAGGWRGTANRGGRPSFSVCQQRNRYFLIYRGRTDDGFFLLALIVSKPLGTNDAVRSSFFPTFQRTVAIINLVIYDSSLQSLPWATHLLFKKRGAKHRPKGYAHTIVPGKKLKYEAFLFSYP